MEITMNSSLFLIFLIFFKWINRFLWVLALILLFAYHLSMASLQIETMFLPTISTFLILLFRKHPFHHAVNMGVLIFSFLKACLDGQITDLSLYLSIWILLIFMIWYPFKHPSARHQTLDLNMAIQVVDLQPLENHKSEDTPLEMWSFRFTVLLWLLTAHLIILVYLLAQKESLFDLSMKNHMNQMAISKQTWFLFYQPEIMYLTLLFLLIWFFIFQNTLKSWDQQIKALEDINQWKLWGGLIFGILFLLLAL